MARTKASVGAKVSSGKSSKARCSAPPPSSGSSGSSSRDRSASRTTGGGGNPVCPRETPKWQRPITNFFIGRQPSQGSEGSDDDGEGKATNSKPKRNIILSDDEEAPENVEQQQQQQKSTSTDQELPTNKELDETIVLEPLTGEDSHKIEEYYPKNGVKGKGKGKKTNKENIGVNNENKDVNNENKDVNNENKDVINENKDVNGKRKSVKRDLEDVSDENEHVSKRVKVN